MRGNSPSRMCCSDQAQHNMYLSSFSTRVVVHYTQTELNTNYLFTAMLPPHAPPLHILGARCVKRPGVGRCACKSSRGGWAAYFGEKNWRCPKSSRNASELSLSVRALLHANAILIHSSHIYSPHGSLKEFVKNRRRRRVELV